MGTRTALLLLFAGSAAGCGRSALHGAARPQPDAGADSARGTGGLLLNLGPRGAGGMTGSGGSEEPWNFGGYGGGVPTALQGEMVMLASDQADPVSIAVDDTTVYWGNTLLTNPDVGTTIVSVPIEGGPATILVRSFRGGGIAISGEDLYWTAYNTGDDPTSSLMRMPKHGGSPVKLGSGLMPDHIAVRPDAVYGTGEADNGFVAARIATGDGAFRTLMSPAAGDTSPWIDGGSVTVLATGLQHPAGIVVDHTSVYWANTFLGTGHGYIMKLTPK